jgi:hypothetical protein
MPPGNPPAPAKVTSLTDPTAAWTNKGQRKVGFAYGANYLIDLQQAIIVDAEATPACWSAEVAATKTVLDVAAKEVVLWDTAEGRVSLEGCVRPCGVVVVQPGAHGIASLG